MSTVVIIGLGNIGSRHLEAVLKNESVVKTYCVDVAPPARAMPLADTDKIIFVDSIERLPCRIDVAIISTPSAARFGVFSDLIKHSRVNYIVFEKVLFQKEEEYYKTEDLLRKNGVSAWVNCPRRISQSWIYIKERFENCSRVSFSCSGGRWGIACNAIHYLDFVQWLSGGELVEINDIHIDGELVESKRSGYKEFFGLITGQCGKNRPFAIECGNNAIPFEIELLSEDSRLRIVNDELEAQLISGDKETDVKRIDLEPVFVSHTTTVVLDDLLTKGTCDLPSYAESMSVHLEFIGKLMYELEKRGVERGLCPIT